MVNLFVRSLFSGRKFLTSSHASQNQIIRSSHSPGGIPGENLPFQLKNVYRLTAWFAVFFGSGLAVPFLVLRHQLKKQ